MREIISKTCEVETCSLPFMTTSTSGAKFCPSCREDKKREWKRNWNKERPPRAKAVVADRICQKCGKPYTPHKNDHKSVLCTKCRPYFNLHERFKPVVEREPSSDIVSFWDNERCSALWLDVINDIKKDFYNPETKDETIIYLKSQSFQNMIAIAGGVGIDPNAVIRAWSR